MAISHLPMLLDTISENTDVLAQQNRENIDRIYAYLQGFISDVEETNAIDDIEEDVTEGVTSVVLQGVKTTVDQTLFSQGNINNMSFPVVAGHYYTIKFTVIARADIGSGVGFALVTPTSTSFAAQGVV